MKPTDLEIISAIVHHQMALEIAAMQAETQRRVDEHIARLCPTWHDLFIFWRAIKLALVVIPFMGALLIWP